MTTITQAPFFMTEEGQANLYTLKNRNGMSVSVTNWGGYIVSILTPDKNGLLADVTLSYNGREGFLERAGYFGATVGRNCNRIGGAQITLAGKHYQLPQNDHGNNLHSGPGGLDHKLWRATPVEDGRLVLEVVSADGEDGFPGTLMVTLELSLSEENALTLHYRAKTDADTLCNLTNHTYFNLSGHYKGSILGHELRLCASRFAETDAESIPTGRLLPVAGTPMDFLEAHTVGERIDEHYRPLLDGKGYDHCWVLDQGNGSYGLCAVLCDPASGRRLECYTDMPAVQVYSGNYISQEVEGKGGVHYCKRAGIALETQFIPDAIHHSEWDSPVLRAGEPYDKTTVYQFFAE